jgi:hypothetical protein
MELRALIQQSGDFFTPYAAQIEMPKRDIVECMIMVGGIVETSAGWKNAYLPFCGNVNDNFSESMWQDVWSKLRKDLPSFLAKFSAFIQVAATKLSCDSTCPDQCDGYPHLDPVVTNYIQIKLESKKINLRELIGFKYVM